MQFLSDSKYDDNYPCMLYIKFFFSFAFRKKKCKVGRDTPSSFVVYNFSPCSKFKTISTLSVFNPDIKLNPSAHTNNITVMPYFLVAALFCQFPVNEA